MHDLLTITLNPALDVSSATAKVAPGLKLRMDPPVYEPGGGGINVARAAARLGNQPRAIAALGGMNGLHIGKLLQGTGVSLLPFEVEGETRQNLAVTDRASGQQYRLQMPGPVWTPAMEAEVGAMIVREAAAIGDGAVVVLSGSQPPGMRPGFAQALAGRLAGQARLVIDTSGAALEQLVQSPVAGAEPLVLRMDQEESEALVGHALPDVSASLDAAQAMVAAGVSRCVVMARGAEGSVLATGALRLHASPPKVTVVSPIGAGDSFTAAFALTLGEAAPGGEDWAAALRAGTAAAAAAVMTPGSELFRPDEMRALLPRCTLREY